MPVDSSIYSRSSIPDFGDRIATGMQNGMNMRQMMDKGRLAQEQEDKDRAIGLAYQNSMVRNSDGTTSLDRNRTMSQMANIPGAGKETADLQQQFAAQDAAKQKLQRDRAAQDAQIIASIAPTIKDQPSYEAGLRLAQQQGVDTSKMPATYNPSYVNTIHASAIAAKDQASLDIQAKNADTKAKSADDAHQDRISGRRDKADAKAGVQDQKDSLELDTFLSKGWAGKSGQAGATQGRINSAEAAEQLIEQGKHQNGGLDSRQIEELAQSTGKLLGGGASASARIEALVPHTMFGRAQSLNEWLSNEPKGAEQQAFVARMAETVAREKALAQTQQRQYQIEGLPARSGFKTRNPDLYNSILQGKGIDASMIDPNGRYKAPGNSSQPAAAQSHPADNAMLNWAKLNPSAPGAADVLKANGM